MKYMKYITYIYNWMNQIFNFKVFLKLFRKHFPRSHNFNKIFILKKIKISYKYKYNRTKYNSHVTAEIKKLPYEW